jgi:hypothetical protein
MASTITSLIFRKKWPTVLQAKPSAQRLEPTVLVPSPTVLTLCYLIENDDDLDIGVVSISGDKQIALLKKCIHDDSAQQLSNVDYRKLILFKVSNFAFGSGINYVIWCLFRLRSDLGGVIRTFYDPKLPVRRSRLVRS